MSHAWEVQHRRSTVLHQVVRHLERSAGTELPWDSTTAGAFTDRDDLLLALHGVWSRRLSARVDQALEFGESVAEAWRDVAVELAGVRAVLDRHVDDPALRHARKTEHRLLAVAAGLATLGDPPAWSARVGAGFVEELSAGTSARPRRRWWTAAGQTSGSSAGRPGAA